MAPINGRVDLLLGELKGRPKGKQHILFGTPFFGEAICSAKTGIRTPNMFLFEFQQASRPTAQK